MSVPWRLRSYQERQYVIKTLRFYSIFFLSLFVIYQIVTGFFARPYTSDSPGMSPAIEQGDLFIIGPLPWWLQGKDHNMPKRGEIVLFESPGKDKVSAGRFIFEPFIRFITLQQWGGFRSAKRKQGMPDLLIKRVIALPGDWVKIDHNQIYVRPRGSRYFISEFEASTQIYEVKQDNAAPGWKNITAFSSEFPAFQLAKDQVFVVGDNRKHINDSRTFGPISLGQIKGRVLSIYWPPKKMRTIEKKHQLEMQEKEED